jgi:hypothetical protein
MPFLNLPEYVIGRIRSIFSRVSRRVAIDFFKVEFVITLQIREIRSVESMMELSSRLIRMESIGVGIGKEVD